MSATLPGAVQKAESTNNGGSRGGYVVMGIVLLVVVAAGTVVHGLMTDRWKPTDSELLGKFTTSIQELPLQIGGWEGTDEFISDKEFEATNCTAYKSRRFVNRDTGEIISMYVVSGSARHITIHSPDWCYQGAGYKMQDKPVQFDVPFNENSETAQFLTAEFRKPDPTNPSASKALRIFWTYSDDGKWIGPSWAKAFFAGRPAMYKIYLICDVSGRDGSAESSAGVPFTQDTFSTINSVLFANQG